MIGGVFFAAFALLGAFDASNPKRWGNLAFWGLIWRSVSCSGDQLGDLGNGLLVIALALIAGFNGCWAQGKPVTTTPEERRESAQRLGAKLFIPALVIPAVTLAGTFAFKVWTVGGQPVVDPKQATLVSLMLGILVGLVLAIAMIRPAPAAPFQEGRRLMDTVGWAALLPQMLAALGAVFAAAGVGQIIGQLTGQGVAPTIPDPGGRRLHSRHGPVHRHHGQRLRRLPGDDRRHRPAADRRKVRAATRPSSAPSACCRASAAR